MTKVVNYGQRKMKSTFLGSDNMMCTHVIKIWCQERLAPRGVFKIGLGGNVPPRFSKVGSLKLIFWLGIFCVSGVEIWLKLG